MVPRASGPVFMFCAPEHVFGGARQVSFSCFAHPDSFSAVPRALVPVFLFCAPGLIFCGTEGVGSCFHVLRSQSLSPRYRGRRDPFSCFALPDSFSVVPRASGPVFKFCAPGLIFGGTEGVGSRFHVLRSRTRFRQYGGHRVLFSCFARPDSFCSGTRVPGPVFIFCAPGVVSGGIEGIRSLCHILRSRTRLRRYRGHWNLFSCFAPPDSFSALPRVSSPVFMFCAPGHIFGDTECVESHFYVLRARTSVRRYRGRRVPFSCFGLPDTFSA
jgi:hypothetical protein